MEKNRRRKGYTLVELLVVTFITVLFTGMSLSHYHSFTDKKELEKEAQEIYDVFSLAREYSLANRMPPDDSCQNIANLEGWGVRYSNSNSQFFIYSRCEGVNTDQISSIKLKSTTINPSIFTVLFLSPSGTVSSPTSLVIKSKKINSCIKLEIETTGIINLSSPYSC